MATIESLINTALGAESTVTDIVGARYYCERAGQNPTYPCIVYTCFIENIQTLSGDTEEVLVQFDLLGANSTQCKSLREPLKTAMNGAANLKTWFQGHRPAPWDDSIDINREIIDYRVLYDP